MLLILFFDGDAEGKTDPLKGSLKFHRTGDTYRLYGVTGPNQYTKDTLDTFNSTESWDHKVYFQYNSFWPLDKYDISKNHGGPTTKKCIQQMLMERIEIMFHFTILMMAKTTIWFLE